MNTPILIAGLISSALAIGLALLGGSPLLAVFLLGLGIGLKVAYLFGGK